MTREKIDDVLGEFGLFISEELATTQVAIGSLRVVAHRTLAEFDAVEDKHATRLLGSDVPGSGWIPVVQGIEGARSFVADVAEGGRMHRRLTQQWIVTVYTGWESEFRVRIAAARGVDEGSVRAEFFGDLRHLRNDIVHNRGVASREHSTKCKAVLKRELRHGDPVYLRDDELQWVSLLIPWAALLGRTAT